MVETLPSPSGIGSRGWRLGGPGKPPRHACRTVALALALFCTSAFTAAAAERAAFKFSDDGGYQRIAIEFDTLPKYDIKGNDSVLIISFDQPIDVGNAFRELDKQKYIIAARLDPDGSVVRFALTEKLSVNTIEAGDRLFVDLLPQSWQGDPPRLPQDVITELTERARVAEKAVRREALLREAEEKNRKVVVPIGKNPTFTRISFDWPNPPIARLTRDDNKITIAFDQIATPLIGQLKADPPRFVRSTDFAVEEDGLKVMLTVEAAMDVRAFREVNSYTLDIADPMCIGITSYIASRLEGLRNRTGDARAGLIQVNSEWTGESATAGEAAGAVTWGAADTAQGDKTANDGTAEDGMAGGRGAANRNGEDIPTVVITERPLDRNGDPISDEALKAAKERAEAAKKQAAAAEPALNAHRRTQQRQDDDDPGE